MQVRLLGTVEISGDPADTPGVRPLAGPRRKAVLAMLALHPHQLVTTDRIIEAVWSTHPPATAVNTVQSHVSYLRRLLGTRDVIATHGPGYVFAPPDDGVDVEVARRLVDAGRAEPDPAVAVEVLSRAVGLWRGRPLADLEGIDAFDRFAVPLEQLRLCAVELLVQRRLDLGQHAAVIPELQELVRQHRLREELHAHLMLALYRAGRQSEALQAYRDARRYLVEELGVEPGTALRRLETAILQQDPALGTPTPVIHPPRPTAPTGRGDPGGPHRPPRVLSEFVGRTDELEVVARLLATAPVVTVLGPGGAGKTRLCLEAAGRLADRFPDGVAFVDLAATPADAVTHRIADSLGVAANPGVSTVDAVRAVLSERRCLLLLDNCEKIVDAAAAVVGELAGAGPAVRVLATSREPLRVPGEHCLPLAPLPVPPPDDTTDPARLLAYGAVRLLVQRAEAADPAFTVDSANARDVAALCRSLDGLPLALELAAARLRTMTPAELLSGLDGRFALLDGAVRGCPPRHRSLHAAMRWSHDLLDPTERAVFRRMAVFADGAAMSQATAVCLPGPAARAGQVLTALMDKSLVRRDVRHGASRLSMHETLRRYAAGLLDEAGETDQVARRHAETYRDLATGSVDARRAGTGEAALDRLRPEDANLRAALCWAIDADPAIAVRLAAALWWYWFRAGLAAEGLAQLRRIVDNPAARACPEYLDALAGLGYLAWVLDDYPAAAHAAGTVIAAPEAGDSQRALAYGVLARAAGDGGDLATAAAHAARGAALYQRAGDPWGVAWSRRCESSALLHLGDVHAGQARCKEAYDTFTDLGDEWGAAGAVDLLAVAANLLGEHERAYRLATDAVDRHGRLADTSGTRYALHHLAEAALRTGRLDQAWQAAERELALARRHGYRMGTLRALLLLADVADRRGDRETCARYALPAGDLARELGDPAAGTRAAQLLAGTGVPAVPTGALTG